MTGGLRAKEVMLRENGWTFCEIHCRGPNGGMRRRRRRWCSPDGVLVLPAPEAFKLIPQPAIKGNRYRRARIRCLRFGPDMLMTAISRLFRGRRRP